MKEGEGGKKKSFLLYFLSEFFNTNLCEVVKVGRKVKRVCFFTILQCRFLNANLGEVTMKK